MYSREIRQSRTGETKLEDGSVDAAAQNNVLFFLITLDDNVCICSGRIILRVITREKPYAKRHMCSRVISGANR